MTDKVQKIRAFLVGIADADGVSTILARAIEKKILPYIDSLQEESVSEGLEEAAFDYAEACKYDGGEKLLCVEHFKAGAKCQKEQIMNGATDVTVHVDAGGYPYVPKMELYDYDNDVPLAKEGDKYKVILIKEV